MFVQCFLIWTTMPKDEIYSEFFILNLVVDSTCIFLYFKKIKFVTIQKVEAAAYIPITRI